MTPVAALDGYLLTVHKIPEYIDALNASDPVALIVSELDRIEAATEWHTDGTARRPDGEGLDGHHDTYVFVRSGAEALKIGARLAEARS